jgi:transposase
MQELKDFEQAIGRKLEVNRKVENVDLKDSFVDYCRMLGLNYREIMEAAGLSRTMYYASQNRFNTRFGLYPEYREKHLALLEKLKTIRIEPKPKTWYKITVSDGEKEIGLNLNIENTCVQDVSQKIIETLIEQ